MTEKVLCKNKNGMAMLLILLAAAVTGLAFFFWCISAEGGSVIIGVFCLFVSIVALFLMAGLKVLKPQEALVLTLFGKYVGTLKGEGFYWVNPFCSAVNPAAGTQLNQSGDVKSTRATEPSGMKISLKIMTLSNNKKKINDCL